jgi:hypothetical protein
MNVFTEKVWLAKVQQFHVALDKLLQFGIPSPSPTVPCEKRNIVLVGNFLNDDLELLRKSEVNPRSIPTLDTASIIGHIDIEKQEDLGRSYEFRDLIYTHRTHCVTLKCPVMRSRAILKLLLMLALRSASKESLCDQQYNKQFFKCWTLGRGSRRFQERGEGKLYFEQNDVEHVQWGRPVVKKKREIWQFLAGNAKPKKRKERDAAY